MDKADVRFRLARTLAAQGEQQGDNRALTEAIGIFQSLITETKSGEVKLELAELQNNYGNALRILGELESGTARLEEAVEAYHEALKERTRDRMLPDWAMTQSNL